MNANSDASGNALFGMITVQADSCLNSEQIDNLFISVGGQEGGLGGGGVFWAGGPKNAHDCHGFYFDASWVPNALTHQVNPSLMWERF